MIQEKRKEQKDETDFRIKLMKYFNSREETLEMYHDPEECSQARIRRLKKKNICTVNVSK